jgi:hypothetical protein
VANKSKLMPIVMAGATLAVVLYAFRRIMSAAKSARTSARYAPQPKGRFVMPPDPLTLDLSDVFDGQAVTAPPQRG